MCQSVGQSVSQSARVSFSGESVSQPVSVSMSESFSQPACWSVSQ